MGATLNGHDAAHHLEESRNAKRFIANALNVAAEYLDIAKRASAAHGFTYRIPSVQDVVDARDRINRELTP